VDGIRSEINDMVVDFIDRLKGWNIPYSKGSSKDMSVRLPLLIIGGDFNLYPGTTGPEPQVRSLIPGRGDGNSELGRSRAPRWLKTL